jgi:hypothetical protein
MTSRRTPPDGEIHLSRLVVESVRHGGCLKAASMRASTEGGSRWPPSSRRLLTVTTKTRKTRKS